MRCNCALWDRILRFIFGVSLTAYAIAGGPFWAYIGIYGLLTSAWGLCPVYAFFRIRTLREYHRTSFKEE
ncbi:hypothetical protein D3C87_1312060 [compost metagenome]